MTDDHTDEAVKIGRRESVRTRQRHLLGGRVFVIVALRIVGPIPDSALTLDGVRRLRTPARRRGW